jgi:hypothetical protein
MKRIKKTPLSKEEKAKKRKDALLKKHTLWKDLLNEVDLVCDITKDQDTIPISRS